MQLLSPQQKSAFVTERKRKDGIELGIVVIVAGNHECQLRKVNVT